MESGPNGVCTYVHKYYYYRLYSVKHKSNGVRSHPCNCVVYGDGPVPRGKSIHGRFRGKVERFATLEDHHEWLQRGGPAPGTGSGSTVDWWIGGRTMGDAGWLKPAK